MLRQELSINPMLEEVETLETEEPDAPTTEEPVKEKKEEEKIDWDEYLGEESEFYQPRIREKEERLEISSSYEKSLYDHLIEQLSFCKITEEEYQIGEFIIGNIDDNGFLTISLEEVCSTLKCSPEQATKVLQLIQSFDPPGIGSRDLKEVLLLQLKEKGLEGSLAYKIVQEHLTELNKKSPSQLAKILEVSLEKIEEALEVIKSLSPQPTLGKFTIGAQAIVPDLIVEKINGEFVVYHNDKYVPHLRVSPAYKDLLKKDNHSSEETKTYIKEKLDQARWLINAINQRRSTMVKVMQAIIEHQKEFFETGHSSLKPLIMEEIANKIGMHVATVSRVSNDKYVQTPYGVFEIRHFFDSGLTKDSGEEMSKRTLKEKIEQMIKNEDPLNPLSDQAIFRLLQKEGINLARRTVTKYREELKILPARFRKRSVKDKESKISEKPEGTEPTT
jgi:RNA polymerase sigma-54 factor